jgi:hydrogenase/urease accessory protein HupE
MRERSVRRPLRAAAARALRLLILASLAWPASAAGHALAPALLELRETAPGIIAVLWRHPYSPGPGITLTPELPSVCRASTPAVETADEAAMESRWTLDCAGTALAGMTVGLAGLADSETDALLRAVPLGGEPVLAVLRAGHERIRLPARARPAAVFADYLALGFHHILLGPDHLLLILCLMWLVAGARRLVTTLTCFTVGHSITLALAVLDVARVPQAPVEAAIAASVLWLAVEAARGDGRGIFTNRPWLAAMSFGLLHGLGFAGALRETGLPAGEVPLALAAFNAGIEAGQIAFVAAVLLACSLVARSAPVLPAWTRRLPIEVAGSLAAMWTIQRTAVLFL